MKTPSNRTVLIGVLWMKNRNPSGVRVSSIHAQMLRIFLLCPCLLNLTLLFTLAKMVGRARWGHWGMGLPHGRGAQLHCLQPILLLPLTNILIYFPLTFLKWFCVLFPPYSDDLLLSLRYVWRAAFFLPMSVNVKFHPLKVVCWNAGEGVWGKIL